MTASRGTCARGLHESPIALKLALTTCALSLAVFPPISGWVSDRFGSRGLLLGEIVAALV